MREQGRSKKRDNGAAHRLPVGGAVHGGRLPQGALVRRQVRGHPAGQRLIEHGFAAQRDAFEPWHGLNQKFKQPVKGELQKIKGQPDALGIDKGLAGLGNQGRQKEPL